MLVKLAVQMLRTSGYEVLTPLEYDKAGNRMPARSIICGGLRDGVVANYTVETKWVSHAGEDRLEVVNPEKVKFLCDNVKTLDPENPVMIPDPENPVPQHFSPSDLARATAQLQAECHNASYAAGWWHHAETGYPYIPGDNALARDAETGEPVEVPWSRLPVVARDLITHYWPIFIAAKMALIHTEVSEAMEAHRKDKMDDKLSHRLGIEAEIADAMIREYDLAGGMSRAARLGVVTPGFHHMNLGTAIEEKRGFNLTRPDHQMTARRAAGGKKY